MGAEFEIRRKTTLFIVVYLFRLGYERHSFQHTVAEALGERYALVIDDDFDLGLDGGVTVKAMHEFYFKFYLDIASGIIGSRITKDNETDCRAASN